MVAMDHKVMMHNMHYKSQHARAEKYMDTQFSKTGYDI